MNSILTIAQKELKSYFSSPIAYGLLTFFAIISGYFSYIAIAITLERSMMMRGGPMDINEWIIRPVMSNVGVISLFLIPMISMRLFAEEKRSGTIELLVTSPITDLQIILGKWLGAVAMYTCVLLIALINLSFPFMFGNPDWRPTLTAFGGLLLQGSALLAVGTFISNTTRNQIVAGVATFGLCLLLWTLDWVSSFKTDGWAKVMSYISLTSHFEPFSKGVIDTKDLIYFLSVIALGLFLTARSLESLRWRS